MAYRTWPTALALAHAPLTARTACRPNWAHQHLLGRGSACPRGSTAHLHVQGVQLHICMSKGFNCTLACARGPTAHLHVQGVQLHVCMSKVFNCTFAQVSFRGFNCTALRVNRHLKVQGIQLHMHRKGERDPRDTAGQHKGLNTENEKRKCRLTSQLFIGLPSPLSKPLSWKPLCSLLPAICSDSKEGVRTNRFLRAHVHAKQARLPLLEYVWMKIQCRLSTPVCWWKMLWSRTWDFTLSTCHAFWDRSKKILNNDQILRTNLKNTWPPSAMAMLVTMPSASERFRTWCSKTDGKAGLLHK